MTLLYPRPSGSPQLNTSHPAAVGMSGNHGLAAAVIGSQCKNLINSQFGTVSGGTFSTIDIGDVWTTSQGGTNTITFTGVTTQDTVCTMAAIVEVTNSNQGAILFSDSSDTGGFLMQAVNTVSGQGMDFVMPNVLAVTTSSITVGQSTWLLLMSRDASNIYFLALDMTTGATQTQTIADSHTAAAPTNAQTLIGSIGGGGAAGNIGGSLAVAAFSPTGLTPTQLSNWASNPWGLWYVSGVPVGTQAY